MRRDALREKEGGLEHDDEMGETCGGGNVYNGPRNSYNPLNDGVGGITRWVKRSIYLYNNDYKVGEEYQLDNYGDGSGVTDAEDVTSRGGPDDIYPHFTGLVRILKKTGDTTEWGGYGMGKSATVYEYDAKLEQFVPDAYIFDKKKGGNKRKSYKKGRKQRRNNRTSRR